MFDPKTPVLIVDDMTTMRKIMIKLCRDIGLTEVSEAGDSVQALKVIQESKPPIALVLCDWTMPNSSGLDVLKRIRGDGRFNKVPVLTLMIEEEAKQFGEDAVKAGADDFIIKPFNAAILKEKLTAIHKKRGA